ncbi:unnamed protein product [Symbiodinium microadriaticum]|nr:unnamed protein product [Symbiodinium microadriaticum]
MASMMGGMGDAMKEQAKKKIEDEMAEKAPGPMKPFFPCCGGPVGTMEKCICMVPADQQEQVKSAIQKYKVAGSFHPDISPLGRDIGTFLARQYWSCQALVAAEPGQEALVSRGGGRGLKANFDDPDGDSVVMLFLMMAVQNAREQSSTVSGPDGTHTESKKSVKEQRLFRAHNNAHVETKVMSEQKRKTTKKDGTVVVTESKSIRFAISEQQSSAEAETCSSLTAVWSPAQEGLTRIYWSGEKKGAGKALPKDIAQCLCPPLLLAGAEVTPKHQRGADDVTPERVLQRISGLMTEMTAMETSLENLRDQMEKEEAQHLDLEPLLELEEEDEGAALASAQPPSCIFILAGRSRSQGAAEHTDAKPQPVFAHLKRCVLVICLTRTPFRWRLRAAQPMSCDAPDYRLPSKAKMARRRRPQKEGAPEKRRSLLRQKPASLGFLAHGGPGERQMREQMLQMRAEAAAAASASRQALARGPRPTLEEEARLEAGSIHDYTKQAIEEAGDSSTVSCWSGDDRSSEVVMEHGHGTDDDTLGVSSPVSEFDFEATCVAQHPWEAGGAGVGVQRRGSQRPLLSELDKIAQLALHRHDIQSRPVTLLGESPQSPQICLTAQLHPRLLALIKVCCRALPPGPKGCNHVLQRDVRCRIPPPPHPRRPSPPPPDHHPDYYHYHYRWYYYHYYRNYYRLDVGARAWTGLGGGSGCILHTRGCRCSDRVRQPRQPCPWATLKPHAKSSLGAWPQRPWAVLCRDSVRLDQRSRAEASSSLQCLGRRNLPWMMSSMMMQSMMLTVSARCLAVRSRASARPSFLLSSSACRHRSGSSRRAGESSRASPAMRNRSPAGRASCRPSQKGRQGKSGMAGLHLHRRGQKQYYRASVVAGPFCLKTGLTQGADKARRFLEALLRIRARVLASSLQEPACTEQGLEALEVAFRSAIQEEIAGLGSGRLYFYANIPASYWVGQALTTPHFPVLGGGLDHGLRAWRLLSRMRLAIYTKRTNRYTILRHHRPDDLEAAWSRLRQTHIEVWAAAGRCPKQVEARLSALEAKHQACRVRRTERWQHSSKRPLRSDEGEHTGAVKGILRLLSSWSPLRGKRGFRPQRRRKDNSLMSEAEAPAEAPGL